MYPPFLLRNTSGLQLVYGHGPTDGVSSVLPAAGQDVHVAPEPSLLASLLGLAFGTALGNDDAHDDPHAPGALIEP